MFGSTGSIALSDGACHRVDGVASIGAGRGALPDVYGYVRGGGPILYRYLLVVGKCLREYTIVGVSFGRDHAKVRGRFVQRQCK
jgi:hypothetical protein